MNRGMIIAGLAAVAIVGIGGFLILTNHHHDAPTQQSSTPAIATPAPPDLTYVLFHFKPGPGTMMVGYDLYGATMLPLDKLGLQEPGTQDFTALPTSYPDGRSHDLTKYEKMARHDWAIDTRAHKPVDQRRGLPSIEWSMTGGFQPTGNGEYVIRVPASIFDNYGLTVNVMSSGGGHTAMYKWLHPRGSAHDIYMGVLTAPTA